MKDNACFSDNLTTVAVIGNGPSAIYLSYLLSGNWPTYNGRPHPNEILHQRLLHLSSSNIVELDLQTLCEGLEGRTTNQMALLMDTLTNPYADLGMDSPSLIQWQANPEYEIPHVVIGRGVPGGAWQSMEREMKSLSLNFLLQLPDMHFGDWLKTCRSSSKMESKLDESRATVDEVCQYFQDFVDTKGLAKNFLSNRTVLGVRKIPFQTDELCRFETAGRAREDVDCIDHGGGASDKMRRLHANLLKERDYIWEVCGIDDEGKEFCIRAISLVLATGSSDCPNKLGVKGEDLEYVLHTQADFGKVVRTAAKTCGKKACRLRRSPYSLFRIFSPQVHSKYFDHPVVIVGSGLSAADAILYAIDRQISVYHVFRSDHDAVDKFYSSLSPVTYPEYVRVYNLIKGKTVAPGLYKCFPGANIIGFNKDRQVLIGECEEEETTVVQAALVVVLIGSRPDLSFLGEEMNQTLHRKCRFSKNSSNLVDINPISYESRIHQGLYAMGPLAGDNFVRFLGGGAVAILSDLIRGNF